MSRPGSSNMMIVEPGHSHHSCDKHTRDRPSSGGRKKLTKRPDSASSLEILPPEGENRRCTNSKGEKHHTPHVNGRPSSSQSDSSRPSSSNAHRRAPPIARQDSATRRTPTPTKQIALQAVRRKTEREGDFGAFDWSEHDAHSQQKAPVKSRTKDHSRHYRPSTHPSTNMSHKTAVSKDSPTHSVYSQSTDSIATDSTVSIATSVASSSSSGSLSSNGSEEELGAVGGAKLPAQVEQKEVKSAGKKNGASQKSNSADIENSDQFDTDLEDEEEDSTSSEEEKIKAPNQLLMEFLGCIMEKDYENANKLCKMILIYEPDNPEALNFQSVIEDKLQMDAEAEAEGSGDTDSDGDDDEDDNEDDDGEGDSGEEDSDDDSDDDSSEEDSDDDDDNDDDDKEEKPGDGEEAQSDRESKSSEVKKL